MTTVYLAYSPSVVKTLAAHVDDGPVDLLVAYTVLDAFLKQRHRFNVGRWVLDSGAFSVLSRGATIDLKAYTARCKDVDAAEVFGLDVIGDAAATRANLEYMWAHGVPAIPTYHFGQPVEALEWCAAASSKIALGGIASKGRRHARYDWLTQCVGHVWPKRVHAFGTASMEGVASAPLDSMDAGSWFFAPLVTGHWAGYTGKQMAVGARGQYDLWIEVEEYRRRAQWGAFRWRRELAIARGAAEPQPVEISA